MSLRQDYNGKSLKGFTTASASSGEGDSTTTSTSRSFNTVDLENVFILSGIMDDVVIGSIIPASGSFAELTVGVEGGPSGNVTIWGDNANDYMLWDPTTGTFYINGELSVRDPVTFGNIVIYDNTIEAVRPLNTGDINLLPQPNGQVGLAGNLAQTTQGYIAFNNATSFSAVSSSSLTLDGNTSTRLTSRNGNVLIGNDYVGTTSTFTLTKIQSTPATGQPLLTTITTSTNHTYNEGDQVKFVNTTTAGLPSTSTFIVTSTPTTTTFTVTSQTLISSTINNQGTVAKARVGEITLDSGTSVNMTQGTPLSWGPTAKVISTSGNDLTIKTSMLTIEDPIPTINLPSDKFSDSGISMLYKDILGNDKAGFFGFIGTTDLFTWVPDATITLNPDGSKKVTGLSGRMKLDAIVTNRIEGDPDLILYAPRNIILDAGNQVRTNVGKQVLLGNSTLTPMANGTLQLVTAGNLQISPSAPNKGIQLDTGAPIFLNGSAQTQTIVGSNTGLNVSSNSSINFSTPTFNTITIPNSVYLTFGSVFQRIYGDPTGLQLESVGDISLRPAQPNGAVKIPMNTKQIFGDNGNFIVGGGANAGMTMQSNGTLNLNTNSTIFLSPTNQIVQINATSTNFPATATLNFGTSGASSLAVTPTTTTLKNNAPNSKVTIEASQGQINLNATVVNIPLNVPLTFGNLATVTQTSTDFSINSPNTTRWTTHQFIVDGNFQVNGNISYISTETSIFKDPILGISTNPPPNDQTHKGFQFEWYDNTTKKLGAVYFNTQEQTFYLGKEVTNTNEILSTGVLGNLKLGNLTATGIATSTFVTNRITGTPDLYLEAIGGSIFLEPTRNIQIPQNIPIVSGVNSIVSSTTGEGWVLTSPKVSIPNGSLMVGPSTFTMTSTTNLEIGGVPTVSIASTLNVLSTVTFGTGQNKINLDSSQNMVLTSLGNIIFTSNAMMNGGMTMGNALMTWSSDVGGGKIVWENVNPTTQLALSIEGAIYDAEWKGQPIGLEYGGTGYEGTYSVGSVIFVDSSNSKTYLSQNPAQFFWDNSQLALGLRTSSPQNTLTVGQGHIDLADNGGSVYFRHQGSYAFQLGKSSVYNLLTIKTIPIPTINPVTLQPILTVSPQGIIGINTTEAFMQSTATTTTARLYVNGNQRFTTLSTNLGWSDTQYITATADNDMQVHASSQISFHAPTFHHNEARFQSVNNKIWGASGNKLHISTLNATYFRSPHNVFVGRCCFYHDPTTDTCLTYAEVNDTTGNINLVNNGGNITLSPIEWVNLPSATKLTFGSAGEGTIQAQGTNIVVTGTNKLILDPDTSVNIDGSTPLVFGTTTNTTSLFQSASSASGFQIQTTTPITLNTTSTVVVPDNVPISFGSTASPRTIVSDGNNLILNSLDDIQLRSNLVRITGDLIVDGYTTQRFFTETSMESGIIQLGGSSITNITNLEQWSTTTETRVTTDAPHYLKIGDQVTIANSDPNIDGTYPVTAVPTGTSFVIPLVVPVLDPTDLPTGQVRSVLTSNPNRDIGIQTNWHTGTPETGTTGYRSGFFGVLRSTNRFTYLVSGTNVNGNFSPTSTLGDAQFNTVYANFLNATSLSGPLNAQNFTVTGTNFQINGGNINNTPIGSTIPSTGYFTNLSVSGTLTLSSTAIVANMNADMVDGKHANEFVWTDGSQPLSANWNAGLFQISSRTLASTILTPTSVVFASTGGVLSSNPNFTFNNTTSTLSVANVGSFTLQGELIGNGQTASNLEITASNITNSNYTLSATSTLDARLGTVLFRTGQISGNAISGGIANTSITGNANTVTNGVYSTLFTDHSIIKADTANSPVALSVTPNTIVGRLGTDPISALSPAEVRTIINVAEMGTENTYEGGALLREGNTAEYPDGGTMTGLLARSSEYLELQSDQVVSMSSIKNLSYISITLSAGSNVTTVVLPSGTIQGQEKIIIIDDLPNGVVVRIMGDIVAPRATAAVSLWSDTSNTVAYLIWNHRKGFWNPVSGLIASDSNPF